MNQWSEEVERRIKRIQNKVRNNLYRNEDFLAKYNFENQELDRDIWKIIYIVAEAVKNKYKEEAMK